MIKIKCAFPFNYYLLRKVKVFHDNKFVNSVGHNEEIELPNKEGYYTFRLDYHKARIQIPQIEGDKLLLLHFNFRNKFPFYYTDVMFKNALVIKEVNSSVFNTFSTDFYNIQDYPPMRIDFKKTIIICLGYIFSCLLIGASIFNEKLHQDRDFVFLIGIIGLFSFSQIIYRRKKLTEYQFRVRALASSMIIVLLGVFLGINLIVKSVFVIIALIIFLLVIKKSPQHLSI